MSEAPGKTNCIIGKSCKNHFHANEITGGETPSAAVRRFYVDCQRQPLQKKPSKTGGLETCRVRKQIYGQYKLSELASGNVEGCSVTLPYFISPWCAWRDLTPKCLLSL